VNCVADKFPVDGLNVSLVLDTYAVEYVPEVAELNVGYQVAFVDVSSVRVAPPVTVAQVLSPRRYVVASAVPLPKAEVCTAAVVVPLTLVAEEALPLKEAVIVLVLGVKLNAVAVVLTLAV
jgi:hypothetical protein